MLVLCAATIFSVNASLPALAAHVDIRATSLPVQRKTTTVHGHVVTVIEHQWRLGEGDLGDCVMRDGAILRIDSETAEAQLSGVFYSKSSERRLLKFKIFGSIKAQPGVLGDRAEFRVNVAKRRNPSRALSHAAFVSAIV